MFIQQHLLDEQIAALGEEAPPADRLELIWRYYEAAAKQKIDRPPTMKQRDDVRAFLQGLRAGPSWPDFYARPRQLRLKAALTLQEKISYLAQARCPTCDILVAPDLTLPLAVTFPVNVEPWSAQSRKDKVRIRKTVTEELAKKPTMEAYDGNLCVTVVSMLSRTSRAKDADNLTKGLLDSMQNILFANDRNIQCLTSRVVKHKGSTGFYLVSAKAVHPWIDDVVSPFDDMAPVVFSNRIDY